MLTLNVTERCNIACIYCCSGGEKRSRPELPLPAYRQLGRECDEHGVLHVTISGGEPLVRDDIDLIDALKPKSRSMTLNTNAMLINNEVATALARRNVEANISIDALDEYTHNLTRPGSHKGTFAGIEACQRAGVDMILACTLTRHNYRQLEALIRFAAELGVGPSVSEVDPIGRAVGALADLSLDTGIRRHVAQQITELPESVTDRVTAGGLAFAHDFLPRREDEDGKMLQCTAAKQSCTVTADGRVIPCVLMSDLVCGNIAESSLTEAWHAEPMRRVRSLASRLTSDIADCRSCRHVTYCSGGCRALGYLATGNLLSRAPRCYAHDLD